MGENTKVVIVAKDGEAAADVRIGCPVIPVHANVQQTFDTPSVDEFASYVAEMEGDEDLIVSYDEDGNCDAFKKKMAPFLETMPVASGRPGSSGLLKVLASNINTKMSADKLESFLYKFRKFYNVDGHTLYGQVRNLSISDVVSVERKKNNNGEVRFAYETKKGPDSPKFPETITISVPIFSVRMEGDTVDVVIDVIHTYRMGSERPELYWELSCPEFGEIICSGRAKIVKSKLAGLKSRVVFGSMSVVNSTDKEIYHIIPSEYAKR